MTRGRPRGRGQQRGAGGGRGELAWGAPARLGVVAASGGVEAEALRRHPVRRADHRAALGHGVCSCAQVGELDAAARVVRAARWPPRMYSSARRTPRQMPATHGSSKPRPILRITSRVEPASQNSITTHSVDRIWYSRTKASWAGAMGGSGACKLVSSRCQHQSQWWSHAIEAEARRVPRCGSGRRGRHRNTHRVLPGLPRPFLGPQPWLNLGSSRALYATMCSQSQSRRMRISFLMSSQVAGSSEST